MMLDHEGPVKPDSFGLDVVFDKIANPSELSNSPLPRRAAALPNRPNRIDVSLSP
jgi:hypothetical protein